MRPLTRVKPALPAAAMKTYSVIAPKDTHFKVGTCEEAGCLANMYGWTTAVDTSSDLGKKQAHYIEKVSGRKYTKEAEGSVVTYTFPADQQCFRTHQIRVDREPLYVVRGGDFRGNPRQTPPRVHKSAEQFVDDFASHQQTLADRLEKG